MNPASRSAPVAPADDLYGHDFHLWSSLQAGLLEEGRFGELDLANLIDEVRALGASERREIRNRLGVLLMHLLEWRFQPERRSSPWMATIRDQRDELSNVLADNPSLRHYPAEVMDGAYRSARLQAARGTGIDFPAVPSGPPVRCRAGARSRSLPPILRRPDTMRTCP